MHYFAVFNKATNTNSRMEGTREKSNRGEECKKEKEMRKGEKSSVKR
jgi:hypothetical protein